MGIYIHVCPIKILHFFLTSFSGEKNVICLDHMHCYYVPSLALRFVQSCAGFLFVVSTNIAVCIAASLSLLGQE